MSGWGGAFLDQLRRALPCGRQIIVAEYRGAGLSTDYSDQPLTYYSMAGEERWSGSGARVGAGAQRGGGAARSAPAGCRTRRATAAVPRAAAHLLPCTTADGMLQLLDGLGMQEPVDLLGWSTGE